VPLLQAFKSPERSKKASANFAPFQSKSLYLQASEPSDFCFGASRARRIMTRVQRKQILATIGNVISPTTFASLLFCKKLR
jgi:UDP-N-acetylglucosamine:LPS N-acetylglucosamine transferase